MSTKTAKITKIELKDKPWRGNDGELWFHKVHLDNGDKGEIGGCEEQSPDWLQVGKSLTYVTKQGRFSKVFHRVERGEANEQSHRPGPSRESYSQWTTSKKSVIMDSCLNRSKDLYVAKILKSEKAYRDHAEREYNYILEMIGLADEKEEQVPPKLAEEIEKCQTLDDLADIYRGLTQEEIENKAILNALEKKQKSLQK